MTNPDQTLALFQLNQLRASIDNMDSILIHTLAERFRCTKAVGVLKATYELPPADPAREEYQIARLRRLIEERQAESVEILRGWMELTEEQA